MPDLNYVFCPRSVAVVGASNKEGSVGRSLIENLKAFGGPVYPVNPKDDTVAGLPAYSSLSAIGQPLDLVVIAIPAAAVPSVLAEGGELGVKGAVVISAGFKETGRADLEDELKEICRRYDIALIGPNCLGIINPALSLNASFAAASPAAGRVAFVSQSGAICTAVIDSAKELGLGFSKFMSVGNKAATDELDILSYLAADKETDIIAVYAEQIGRPEELMAQARALSAAGKPVIVLKSGRSSAGASASASHTGALAGNDAAYEALFRQAGIIRADKTEDLFDYARIFSCNRPAPAKRVAIITNAGGPGVIAIDALEKEGLQPAKLSAASEAALSAALPPAANVHNPIDVLGDARADRYFAALETALSDEGVDAAILILTPQSTTEIKATAEAAINAKNKYGKPLAAVFMGEELVRDASREMNAGGLAAYSFPEDAIRSLSVLNSFHESLSAPAWQAMPRFEDVDREAVAAIFASAKAKGRTAFPEASALAVLRAYRLPVLASKIAHSAEEAAGLAEEIGGKIVMKIVSPDILHKSDAGGIMLGVKPEEASLKYEELVSRVAANRPEAKIEGVLMVEMIEDAGTEMILGSVKDPGLGNLIMVGLGGIFVELFQDVAFGLNPLSRSDIERMLSSLKAKKLLDGARGRAKADYDALLDAIGRLAQLLRDFPEISELDINPLLVLEEGKGAKALDARILLS